MILNQLNSIGPMTGLWIRLDDRHHVVEAFRATEHGIASAEPILRARGVLKGKRLHGMHVHGDRVYVPVPKSQYGEQLSFQSIPDGEVAEAANHTPAQRL